MPRAYPFFPPIGMITMSDVDPQPWEIWHARFAYEGGKGYKYRPVIILGRKGDGSIAMMVTSSTNKLHMEHDYLLVDWESAGLVKPSIARIDRIAEIPASSFGSAGFIGRLSESDIASITEVLSKL